MKTVLDNKKISCTPPIYHNNNYITDFTEKARIFNNFFVKQCTLVENTKKPPSDSFKRTNNLPATISFTKDGIAKIIKNLNQNKAHDFGMISICILNILCDWILKPLELIFKSCIESEKFPIEWKNLMLPQFTKKKKKEKEKETANWNPRPISLLPVCGKILERIVYYKMFEFFSENELISHNYSGFKPGDLINYDASPAIFINLLIMALRKKVSFLIYPRYLIKFGTSTFSSLWSKMVYQVTF